MPTQWYIGGVWQDCCQNSMDSKDWIPALAESTPRLGQKGSGGNDGTPRE